MKKLLHFVIFVFMVPLILVSVLSGFVVGLIIYIKNLIKSK